MNRWEFHYEHGKTVVDFCNIRRISVNEKTFKPVVTVEEKPVYLQIFFHRPLEEGEIRELYSILILYGLIKATDEELEKEIQEDLEHQDPTTMGTWEIKCDKFQDAFECCYDALSKSYMIDDGAFSFQLSDEPTEDMKHWLRLSSRAKRRGIITKNTKN